MKLAIVHDWLTGMRGGEKCLDLLCRRFPEARLFTLLHVPGSTSPAIENMPITTSFLQRLPGVRRHYRYLLPLMPAAVERLRIPADVDLVVSLSHAVAKSVRPPAGVPHVCYCFTPMRYAWHLREEYFPVSGAAHESTVLSGRISRALGPARNRLLDRIRQWDQATSDRATHYVAISQTVAERIEQCYGRQSTIIHPPVDTDFYTPAAVPREDFYLCVSALVPYKRIELAMAACQRLGRRLIVVGDGPERKRLERLTDANVSLLGWQSDEQIRDLLRRCRGLLFPGHEDFGIVPVEAQACGAPVVALARGGALETVLPATADVSGTGVFFPEPSVESLCQATEWLEQNSGQLSSELARQQALQFTKQRFEQNLVGLLTEVAGKGACLA